MTISIGTRSRLTWLLFIGQSLGSAANIAAFTVSTIVGAQLSGQPAWAGLPGAAFLLGAAGAAYPAARLMDRTGRRLGLTLGFAAGVLGALIAGYAIPAQSFAAFLLGLALMGVSRGVTDLGRYAAGEMYPAAGRGRAISLVVLGGTVGAVAGPALVGPTGELAGAWRQDPLAGPLFAGVALYGIATLLLGLFLRPDPSDIGRRLESQAASAARPAGGQARVRPWSAILSQSGTQLAITAMVIGQLVMVMLMSITSLHMTHLGHGLGQVSLVIMAHTVGMFGLSLVAGRLADGLGRAPTIVLGCGLLIAACLLAPLSQHTGLLALALFLLGLGWNFCFVAGGALLTDSLSLAERGQMQGGTDLLVGLVSAAGSLGSGLVFAAVGYALLSWLSLAVTLVPLALAISFIFNRGPVRAADVS